MLLSKSLFALKKPKNAKDKVQKTSAKTKKAEKRREVKKLDACKQGVSDY